MKGGRKEGTWKDGREVKEERNTDKGWEKKEGREIKEGGKEKR
jgi:hypothetical protein